MITETHAPAAPAATLSGTGFAAGTEVMTMTGPVPVEALKVGDRLITRDGMRPVRAIRLRILRGVRPCRISQNALGNARPERDITVAPDQPILLRDWRARALYGQGTAMVAASRLVDGVYISRAAAPVDLEVHVLDLGTDQVIYADGLEFGVSAL
ncbi:Hint domain-containing protein [Oceaniglobus roseus]|uniref:Hint domain-containing protein n=1 Tax=Oceaniglobus roseus TaxID=1737570 RepID=UPI000C7EDC61|nr:Hint domain-containing protein [Kandeliimicrobium roseum]